jgi:hypothetical protein
MVIANLAIRFLVELIGVGALAWSAYQAPLDGVARIVVTLGAALGLVVVWALVVAPRAHNGLTQPQRDAIGTGLLALVALAVAGAGEPIAAVVFGAVVIINWVLGIVFRQAAADAIGSIAGNRH